MSKIRKSASIAAPGPGTDPAFVAAARAFGKILAENGIGLVYGGGSVGMMGELADAVLDHGGGVTGIIPEFLMARERALRESQELIVTRDMHERKQQDVRNGGRVRGAAGRHRHARGSWSSRLTWAQLGRHKKPIAARQYRRLLGPALRPARPHAGD